MMSADPVEWGVAEPAVVMAGLLLPESVLESYWFAVLSAFVAINTVMYVALALAKTLPKIHVQDWLPRTYVRSQTRSIHPDRDEGTGEVAPPAPTWKAPVKRRTARPTDPRGAYPAGRPAKKIGGGRHRR